ncbi:hypothetical protein JKP88DRAFT_252667 [Tribonema minus]|uniref:Uncharacterized protein n=1 Tax=Tribonema minus TaxID=303371 RepID=A0A835ZG11_9STRA|nr:hypothetical protein JKP88DRAFT_252667 [Tribonema minus]
MLTSRSSDGLTHLRSSQARVQCFYGFLRQHPAQCIRSSHSQPRGQPTGASSKRRAAAATAAFVGFGSVYFVLEWRSVRESDVLENTRQTRNALAAGSSETPPSLVQASCSYMTSMLDRTACFRNQDALPMIQHSITSQNPTNKALGSELARLVTLRSADLIAKDAMLTAAVVDAASTQLVALLKGLGAMAADFPSPSRQELVQMFGATAALQTIAQLLQEGTCLLPMHYLKGTTHTINRLVCLLVAQTVKTLCTAGCDLLLELASSPETVGLLMSEKVVHALSDVAFADGDIISQKMAQSALRQVGAAYLKRAAMVQQPDDTTLGGAPGPTALALTERNRALVQELLDRLPYTTGSWNLDVDLVHVIKVAALAVPWGAARSYAVWRKAHKQGLQPAMPHRALLQGLLRAGSKSALGAVLLIFFDRVACQALGTLLYDGSKQPSLDRQVLVRLVYESIITGVYFFGVLCAMPYSFAPRVAGLFLAAESRDYPSQRDKDIFQHFI